MKLKALIKELQKAADELGDVQVILQKDAEGNWYSPLYCVDPYAVYEPETTWSGTVFALHASAEDHCIEESEWRRLKKKKSARCVVLAPRV